MKFKNRNEMRMDGYHHISFISYYYNVKKERHVSSKLDFLVDKINTKLSVNTKNKSKDNDYLLHN
ncbi:MAG: hypothetical protein LKM44_02045 [Wolbachia endosymbiont of Meromenopon meropis]|nr:hypothetical protein [Wolbachia endosymbiont of Meromenopon meropis]